MITWNPSSGATKIAAKEAKRDYSIITVPDPNFEWSYWKLKGCLDWDSFPTFLRLFSDADAQVRKRWDSFA